MGGKTVEMFLDSRLVMSQVKGELEARDARMQEYLSQATRKLPHYFQVHTIVVLTQLPLKSVLRTADYTRRIAIWGTILGAFDIKYMPQISIKGQVLADLVAKFAEPPVEIVAEE